MMKETNMSDNDQMIYDVIRATLTDKERALFDRVMHGEAYRIGSIGQLVAEALRCLEKFDLLPDHG